MSPAAIGRITDFSKLKLVATSYNMKQSNALVSFVHAVLCKKLSIVVNISIALSCIMDQNTAAIYSQIQALVPHNLVVPHNGAVC